VSEAIAWNEGIIARHVAQQTLAKKCIVLVDRCNWTGHECDVLAVTMDMRIIDVEVKISRSDFKADARKDKWWRRFGSFYAGADPDTGRSIYKAPDPVHRDWPPRVWKHYIAMPAAIWDDALFEFMPSPRSGLLLASERRGGAIEICCERRATPNKEAQRIEPKSVADIARLANLRMWDAYRDAEVARRDVEFWRNKLKSIEASNEGPPCTAST